MENALQLSSTKQLILKHLRLIHSLKTALAVGIGYLVAILLKIPSMQWILITTIVVMGAQTTVGSFVKKCYARALGTVLGAALGIAVLVLWSHNDLMTGMTLTIFTIPFIYLAFRKDDLSYAGVLGIITVIIVIMSEPPTISNGLARIMDVIIGIILSGLTTFLVLPTYARDLFLKNLAPLTQDFANLFSESMLEGKTRKTHSHLQKLDDKIEAELVDQRKLLAESKVEWPRKPSLLPRYKEIIFTCSRIHRHLNFLEYYFYADQQTHDFLNNKPAFLNYCQRIREILNAISQLLSFKPENQQSIYSLPDVLLLEEKLKLSFHESEAKINLIYAFLLSTQRLNFHLEKLLKLLNPVLEV